MMKPVDGKLWDRLFDGYAHKERERHAQRAVSRELEAWYDEQIQLIMTLLREVAAERAAAFTSQSGVQVEVKWPSHPPINIDPDGPFMSFMSLTLPEREVHLYSHRVSHGPPLIHFVVAGAEGSDRQRKRLLGRPGAKLEKREGGGFLLRGVGEQEGATLSVDDLAYRAFSLLLEG
ncbi:MAG TPA: hypothetical protein VFX59_12680 [Polyangiales bacterium]|nr:hypothetical protein [Polyangiales bacterium]